MPTDRFLQGFYRMSAQVLVSYLEKKHGNNWHIWNLQEDSELGYDPQNIGGSGWANAVTRYPVPDHQPIAVNDLIKIAREIRGFIESNPENVALVHCKCGKGRTGTVVIAYLMLFHGTSYESAANEFTQKRIRLGVFDGITIQSQKRYLQYIDHWIKSNQDSAFLAPVSIRIVQLVIRKPNVEDFDIELLPLANSSDDLYEATKTWDTNFKEKYCVLKPLSSGCLPADLLLKFTGYKLKGGYRIATSSVSYAFNVLFEPDDTLLLPIDLNAGEPSPVISSKASVATSLLTVLSESTNLQSCICHWSETDGLGGLTIRGIKAFDSIEIFWAKVGHSGASDTVSSSPPESTNYFAPQATQSPEEE